MKLNNLVIALILLFVLLGCGGKEKPGWYVGDQYLPLEKIQFSKELVFQLPLDYPKVPPNQPFVLSFRFSEGEDLRGMPLSITESNRISSRQITFESGGETGDFVLHDVFFGHMEHRTARDLTWVGLLPAKKVGTGWQVDVERVKQAIAKGPVDVLGSVGTDQGEIEILEYWVEGYRGSDPEMVEGKRDLRIEERRWSGLPEGCYVMPPPGEYPFGYFVVVYVSN